MPCEECFNLDRPASDPCPKCGDLWEMPPPGKPESIDVDSKTIDVAAALDKLSLRKTQTPYEIAKDWYSVDDIHRGILRHADEIPSDIRTIEFAEWLTSQYVLAMVKGISIGRERL